MDDVDKIVKFCFHSDSLCVLKEEEEKQYDEYRFRRLVLEGGGDFDNS